MNELYIILNKIYSVVIIEHYESIIFSSFLLLYGLSKFIKYKKKKFFIIVLFSFIFIVFGPGLFTWLNQLGIDSFIEVQSFDKNDAIFFVTTFPSIIYPDNYKVLITLFFIWFVLFFFFLIIFKIYKNNLNIFSKIFGFTIIFLILFFFLSFYKSMQNFKSPNNLFNEITNNFSFEDANISIERKESLPLKTILYIGESTSIMNMSLYGYYRNTTPYLEKLSIKDGFIKFRNLLSTHTHTSPSLLKALSISYTPEIPDDSFYKIKRVKLVDVLNNVGVFTSWLSNQNQTGTWNYASNILSKNSKDLIWSVGSSYLFPNSISKLKKPYDHEFFLEYKNIIEQHNNSLTILHSLAGHGHYLKYIPEKFHPIIDDSLSNFKTHKAIFGSESHSIFFKKNTIEEYDSTMKYIDYSLNNIIQSQVMDKKDPVVFIYFSDHGESVFTDRAHDASRFLHEMIRIPLVIYFNEAAQKTYKEKFEQILKIAESNQILTLNNISKLISYLYDVEISKENKLIKFDNWNKVENDKILIRNTAEGKEYVSLNEEIIFESLHQKNLLNDQATNLFITTFNNSKHNKKYCYHRSNSVAKVIRGSIAGNCIEIDIVIEDEDIYVYHPDLYEKNYGLTLSHIMEIISKQNISLWIDAKNIDQSDNCFSLYDFFKKKILLNSNVNYFIEFPPKTNLKDEKIIKCMEMLKDMNFSISYYLVDDLIESTFEDLIHNNYVENISFHYPIYDKIKNNNNIHKKIYFNTWFYEDIDEGDFQYMILNSSNDPNSN